MDLHRLVADDRLPVDALHRHAPIRPRGAGGVPPPWHTVTRNWDRPVLVPEPWEQQPQLDPVHGGVSVVGRDELSFARQRNPRLVPISPDSLLSAPVTVQTPLRSSVSWLLAALIIAGSIMSGFAAWDLWGSNVYGRHAQREVAAELPTMDEMPQGAPVTDNTDLLAGARPGTAVARISIPALGLRDVAVVSGTSRASLRKGPGWYSSTAVPGAPGNAAIAAHRTTYGAWFRHLDRLEVGDRITVALRSGAVSVFEVRAVFVVDPSDTWVAAPTPGIRLTLTTCTPAGTSRQRLVVQAELVEGANAALALPAEQWRASAASK